MFLANDINKTQDLKQQKAVQDLTSQIRHIQDDIDVLLNNLDDLRGLLYQTNNEIPINEVMKSFRERKTILLADMEYRLLNGQIDKKKIMEEANQSKTIAIDANSSIVNAREKISLQLQK